MIKYHKLSAAIVAALVFVVMAIVAGCGGSSGGNSKPTVTQSVKAYNNADTPAEVLSAVSNINTAVGVGSSTSPFGIYTMSSTLTATFAELSLMDRQNGYALTLEQLMAAWRGSSATRIDVSNDTLLADVRAAIVAAKANPSGSQAGLLIALDLIDRDINPTLTELTLSSKVDSMVGRLLSLWILENYGLAGSKGLSLTRDDAACQACIDAHNSACKATYDSQVAATESFRAQSLAAVDSAHWLSEAEKAQQRTNINHDCNEENFNHSKQLQSCQNGAGAACAKECEHSQ